MTATTDTFAHADWLAELNTRFGPDPMDWAFQCPSCGDVATGADFRTALADRSDDYASEHLARECIGRVLGALRGPQEEWKGRGCDWTSYGLFRGPVVVTAGEREMFAFRMADPHREEASS